MLVGKGLIASQFNDYITNEDVIIFASGVSNSKEIIQEEFDNELALIKAHVSVHKLFIYFGTCSVFDPSLKDSGYVKHKLKMEKFIQCNFKNFLILRLPNMIGLTNNPNTFFNYFFHTINTEKSLVVQKNAVRYFMDVDDLPSIVKAIINDSKVKNDIINVSYNNPITIPETVLIFEQELKKKANVSLVENGISYTISNTYFTDLCFRANLKNGLGDYTEICFKKYIRLKLPNYLS